MSAHKHDEGKPRLALVPPDLIEAVGIIRMAEGQMRRLFGCRMRPGRRSST